MPGFRVSVTCGSWEEKVGAEARREVLFGCMTLDPEQIDYETRMVVTRWQAARE
jgi:hypothetical protein